MRFDKLSRGDLEDKGATAGVNTVCGLLNARADKGTP